MTMMICNSINEECNEDCCHRTPHEEIFDFSMVSVCRTYDNCGINRKVMCVPVESKSVWQPIEDCPRGGPKEIFVAVAIDIVRGTTKYTTDPYCVWYDADGCYARWPHPFPPTHFMKLPERKL